MQYLKKTLDKSGICGIIDVAVNIMRFTLAGGVEKMAKNLDHTILFDIYSPLLTDKQRDTLDLYYNDDLSLGEIAESSGVTRQAVMGCIQKTEKRLNELEEQLGLADRFRKISRLLDDLTSCSHDDPVKLSLIEQIRDLL